MKRLFRVLCALICIALAVCALRVFRRLPISEREYVSMKYTSWSGVIQGCVCSRWQAGGSFIRWLNRCAAEFEKAHDGVYLEFIECEPAELAGVGEIFTPEVYFLSNGVTTDAAFFSDIRLICAGGYGWAYNRALTDAGQRYGQEAPLIQADDDVHCYTAATLALAFDAASPAAPIEQELDIGLAASADDRDALRRFIAGEAAALAVSTGDIAKLARLREAGRGPDWAIVCPDADAFTDQLLYMLLPTSLPDDGRRAVLTAFADFLVSEKCQRYLSDIGALSVTGENIYPASSPYAAVQASVSASLEKQSLLAPSPFSEYSTQHTANIVRDFFSGRISRKAALEALAENTDVNGR